MSAIPPDRADGVDDPFGRQFVALGDSCLASRAPAQLSAFLEQLRSGGAMDSAIHPAAAKQGRVGGVDKKVQTPNPNSKHQGSYKPQAPK
jgi:hypothetical protein